MDYVEQNKATGRHIFPDLVRAFALFGIVLVNVAYFAFPGEITYFYGGLNSPADIAASFTVDALFLFKSYTLFSFMFGAGLAYQMMAAERRGVAFAPRYFRRMLGLLILGVLHVTVAFVGDILIVYAVIGSLLFLFRNKSVKALLWWAGGFLVLQLIISLLISTAFNLGEIYAPENMAAISAEMRPIMDDATSVFQTGSFQDIMVQRWSSWTGYIVFAGLVQFSGVLSFFLFGLAAVRSEIMQTPKAQIWSRSRRVYLPIGIALNVIGAYLIHKSGDPMSGLGAAGSSFILFGAPLSSMGYMGWIAKWADGPATALKIFVARAGTASLTTYLLQSLILSWVFSGYGLGLYAKLGAASCVAIAVLTGVVTLCLSSLWRVRFERGPMETLLRRWTYLGTG